MDQVDNKVVDEKVISQEVKKESAPETETPEQIHWKRFREAREVERKEKEKAERELARKKEEVEALKAAMESVLSKPQAPIQDVELSEEEKIQKKIDEALAKREQRYEQERIAKEQQELPKKLSSAYSDFDQVCSTQNLDYLEYHYPEIANAYKQLPDSFEKWAGIYKSVKRFIPNSESKSEAKKAEKNFSKPQSMSVSGSTAVGDTAPHLLDDKKREDNWRRMQRVMRTGR